MPVDPEEETAATVATADAPRDDAVAVPVSALDAARELDGRSGRRRAVPVRKVFVRAAAADAPVPPLARLFQVGGRGGVVSIKLYLALIWRCSAPPFTTDKPYRAWATLLGLDDPRGKGTRRIASAMKLLQSEGLVDLTAEPGQTNTVTVRHENGTGRSYTLPSTSYVKARAGAAGDPARARNKYFKIPARLWTEGQIQALRGPGLVLLLILLAEQAGEGERVWFSTEAFPDRYRISHKARAAGTVELQRRGLLDVEREALPDRPTPTPSVYDRQRYRNVYALRGPALLDPGLELSGAAPSLVGLIEPATAVPATPAPAV